MSTSIPTKSIALGLIGCLLLLSGAVMVRFPEHSLHHYRHHPPMHGSLIRTWWCTACDCVESSNLAPDYSHDPITRLQPTAPAVHLPFITIEFPSRGPPQRFS